MNFQIKYLVKQKQNQFTVNYMLLGYSIVVHDQNAQFNESLLRITGTYTNIQITK